MNESTIKYDSNIARTGKCVYMHFKKLNVFTSGLSDMHIIQT